MKLLIEYFYEWEAKMPEAIFMQQPQGDSWKKITWQQAGKEIRAMATYLKSQDLPAKSHIGLISKNCGTK